MLAPVPTRLARARGIPRRWTGTARAPRDGLRHDLILASVLLLAACGDDGEAVPVVCERVDVASGTSSGTNCPFIPKLPAGESSCVPAATAGRDPRIALRADGVGVRAWRDGADVFVETTADPSCGGRHRLPTHGDVRGFEVAIDDVHADVVWSDDAGVSVLELEFDGGTKSYVLPEMTSIARWVALGDGRRISLPGPDGRPAIWRYGRQVGALDIDAAAGEVAYLDGLAAVAVEGGALAFFTVATFPSQRPPQSVLELDEAGLRRPTLAWMDGDLVVAWEATVEGQELVRATRVDGGRQLGSEARILIGPYATYGRRPRVGATATRMVIGTPYDPACGDAVILSWFDGVFERIVDRDLLVALDEAGDGFRFASNGDEIVLAATKLLFTWSETGETIPACASPMFVSVSETDDSMAVLPGEQPR